MKCLPDVLSFPLCIIRSPTNRGGGTDPQHFLTTQQISYGVGEKKGESSHQYVRNIVYVLAIVFR